MGDTTISALKTHRADNVLEARTYRWWESRGVAGITEQLFCCILIDRQGNAIQANMDHKNKDYFTSKFKLGLPYRITRFFCENTLPFQQTLNNPISLRFGRITNFDLLDGQDSEFPAHYFDFISYHQLPSRIPYIDKETGNTIYPILTDYIGRVRSISDIIPSGDAKTGQRDRRKVEIESLNGSIVDFTMWNELAHQFKKETVEKYAFPIIIAVSSCRVSKYQDMYQLNPTSATHFYINPKIQAVADAKQIFKEKYSDNPPLQIVNYRYTDPEQEKHRNRETLRTLLQQNPATYKGVKFTCEASIISINNNRSWQYLSCHECNKASFHLQEKHICEDHGEQNPPPHKYNFKATVADGTETAEFTFFNHAGYKITGHSCIDVVSNFTPTPDKQLPSELTNIIGKRHIFQIQFASNSQKGSGRFIVNDILDLPNLSRPESEGTSMMIEDLTQKPQNLTDQSATSSNISTQNTPAPATPETSVLQNISLPTPPSEQRPQPAKRSLQKQLAAEAKKNKTD